MPDKIKKETIHAKGIDIGIYTTDFENEYISLTDIAKYRNVDDPRLNFLLYGRHFIILILTVCNSRRLKVKLG